MIIVSVTFVVCWFPSTFYFIVVDSTGIEQSSSDLFSGYYSTLFLSYLYYYSTLFLSYLYICMNPFIYAIKHEGVKQKLASLNICRHQAAVHPNAGEGSDVAGGGTRSTRTGGTAL